MLSSITQSSISCAPRQTHPVVGLRGGDRASSVEFVSFPNVSSLAGDACCVDAGCSLTFRLGLAGRVIIGDAIKIPTQRYRTYESGRRITRGGH